MILAFSVWIATILYKSKRVFPFFNHDFLNHDTTNCVNGIFILLVFMSHFNSYVQYTVQSDLWYARLVGIVGQLMVTTFLFYSGYGIMESIKLKGVIYILNIPKKRFLGTLYKFIIAVNFFALAAHYEIPLKTLLLSFVTWTSIGNSNWYIFAILMCYLSVFVSFTVFGNNHTKGCLCVLLLSLVYLFTIYECRKEQHWWYDTILCFPTGMFVSLYKDKLIALFQNKLKTVFLLGGGIGLYLATKNLLLQYHILSNLNIWIFHNVFYIFAVLLIVFITTIARIKNDILEWFGTHLFGFYILQRLPMICLKKAGFDKDIYLFFLLCFIISVVLAHGFSKLTGHLDRTLGL